MTIENNYARVIFDKLFYPAAHPVDYPVKNGKFEADYGGEILEVTVARKPRSICMKCGEKFYRLGDKCKCGTELQTHPDTAGQPASSAEKPETTKRYAVMNASTGEIISFGPKGVTDGSYNDAYAYAYAYTVQDEVASPFVVIELQTIAVVMEKKE